MTLPPLHAHAAPASRRCACHQPTPSLLLSTDQRTHGQGYQYSWCVDPLDGTKEFLKRNGQFTVNIALLRGSQPVLGVVHVPAQVRGSGPGTQGNRHFCPWHD